MKSLIFLTFASLFLVACGINNNDSIPQLESPVNTVEIPKVNILIGNYKGVGFIVKKGNKKITEAEVNKFESSLKITQNRDSKIAFHISLKIQKKPRSRIYNDKRYDIFKVNWNDKNTGTLINTNRKYGKDKTTFTIEGIKLTVKSWIDRNRAFVTQIYEKLPKKNNLYI